MDIGSYRKVLLHNNLVGEQSIAAAEIHLDSPDGKSLGRQLVKTSLLTPWQHQRILRGQRNFRIGDYALLRPLAKGGSGQVFLARRRDATSLTALKLLPPSESQNPANILRFEREGEVHLSLDHPNIVEAHECGVDGNIHFLALEYVEGMDLAQAVQQNGTYAPEAAADCIAQACSAIAYLHAADFIHRDIKPANLIITRDSEVKLADLGIVRLFDKQGPSITIELNVQVLGTLEYMAPE
ncbi:MAG: serine/threonine protein kinase, partial [Planctomycetales bacterium]